MKTAKKVLRRKKTKSYDAFLRKQLGDPELAAEYLSAAVAEGALEGFLVALKNVAEAHGGIGVLARETKLNRQSMYKMFSERGNPTVASLITVLQALGFDMAVTVQRRKAA